MIWKCFLCFAAQKLRSTADLTKCYFYATITTIVMPNPLKSGLFSCWKAPVLGLRISEINNKSSKIFRTRVLERQMAQPRGKLAGICPLMPFPHPLQNRVPRVRILLPLPMRRRRGCLRRLFFGYILAYVRVAGVLADSFFSAVSSPEHRGFLVWSYLFAKIPSASASKTHQSEVEPVCDSLQAGRVFLDVVHLGNL